MIGWSNAEFMLVEREHRSRSAVVKRVRSALAHYMRGGVAACGWKPSDNGTVMLAEDPMARGAFRCERCEAAIREGRDA